MELALEYYSIPIIIHGTIAWLTMSADYICGFRDLDVLTNEVERLYR